MSNQPQNDDDFDSPHLDPEEQNDIDSVSRQIRRIADIHHFVADVEKQKIAQASKPWWVQQSEDGDYMADGSDLQPYEPEEN